MDPFIRMTIGPNQEESEVCRAGHIAPTWPSNPTFFFEIGRDRAANYDKLKVELINSNIFCNDNIGIVEIPLEKIVPDWNRPEEPLWIWVGRHDNSNVKAGELNATVKFVPPCQVIVHEARNLYDVQLIGKQDPYVVMDMVGCIAKGDTVHRKTRTHDDGDRNPKWEETFEFNMLDEKSLRTVLDQQQGRLASAKEEKKAEPGLWLQVVDENVILDTNIGYVFVPLLTLLEIKRSAQPSWQKLNKGKAAEMGRDPAGDICISVK